LKISFNNLHGVFALVSKEFWLVFTNSFTSGECPNSMIMEG
jgi:hypothetical protein